MGKKKKAKRAIKNAQAQIREGLQGANIDNIGNDSNSNFETTELVSGSATPGVDEPLVPFIPEFPYPGKQIILNSGRLHLNAKDDFLILNSKKSISLGAPGSINFDTDSTFMVNAQKIKLGIGEDSDHPLVYGDQLLVLIINLARDLQKVAEFLDKSEDSLGAPIQGAKSASNSLSIAVKNLISSTNNLNSNLSFTK